MEALDEMKLKVYAGRSVQRPAKKEWKIFSYINKRILPMDTQKNWKGYFFEFLLLFLAVTLGFFVDNYREGLSDRNLESQHIRSLLSDLEQDTAMFRKQVQDLKPVIGMCDSVVTLLKKQTRTAHDQQRLYFMSRRLMPRVLPHFVNDRAFEEMRSSGALRLIHHKNIADSISKYYFASKELSWLNNLVLDRTQRKTEVESLVLSAFTMDDMVNKETLAFSPPPGDPPLITDDKVLINQFALSVHYIAAVCVYKRNFLKRLDIKANRLLNTLQNEYPDLK
jgi:hypothetical protein